MREARETADRKIQEATRELSTGKEGLAQAEADKQACLEKITNAEHLATEAAENAEEAVKEAQRKAAEDVARAEDERKLLQQQLEAAQGHTLPEKKGLFLCGDYLYSHKDVMYQLILELQRNIRLIKSKLYILKGFGEREYGKNPQKSCRKDIKKTFSFTNYEKSKGDNDALFERLGFTVNMANGPTDEELDFFRFLEDFLKEAGIGGGKNRRKKKRTSRKKKSIRTKRKMKKKKRSRRSKTQKRTKKKRSRRSKKRIKKRTQKKY